MNICIIDPYENILDKLARIAAYKDPFIRVPLMEDVTIVAESNLNALREKIAFAADLTELGAALEQGVSGKSQASGTAVNLATKLGVPQWGINSTKPIEVQLKLGFFSEVQDEKPLNTATGLAAWAVSKGLNAATDGNYQPGHWIHTLNKLISYSILSIGVDGNYIVPGVGLKDLSLVKQEISVATNPDPFGGLGFKNPFPEPSTRVQTTSKLVRLTLPGIIDIPIAVIPRVAVTYSKQITELGYPLWATADVQIQGIIPAIASDFTNGASFGKQLIATNLI